MDIICQRLKKLKNILQINLGEMNAKLLQKIEELTLYMIEMKKENAEIKRENKKQNKEIKDLKSQLYSKH